MNADEYLKEYIANGYSIYAAETELNSWQDCQDTYGDRIKESNQKKIADRILVVKKQIEDMKEVKRKIYEQINSMENERVREFLTNRYIKGLTYEEIAEISFVDLSTVYRYRKKALKAFSEKYLQDL